MNNYEKKHQPDSAFSELSGQRLYDSAYDPIPLQSATFNSKYDMSDLDKVECFVNDVLLTNELPIRTYPGAETGKWHTPTSLEIEYFRSFPDFIEVVKRLPSQYEYSEQVNAMIDCCQAMGLLSEHFDWKKNWNADPEKTYPCFEWLSGTDIFNTLVDTLRWDWKINNRQAKANARIKENIDRHAEYCDYVDSLFNARARQMVERLDLFYQKQHANSINVFDMTNDFDRLLNNARRNSLFDFMTGYIAKLEFGVEKGLHWHVILFFDGSEKKGYSHINLAKEIGEYWVTVITKGRGDYRNINNNADHYDKLGRLGIGVINWHNTELRSNLKKYVVGYMFKGAQYFRPKWGSNVRLFRRGDFPEISDIRLGRPRKEVESSDTPPR